MCIRDSALSIDEEERTKLERTIQNNMAMLKEIYIHLQGLSKNYPWIDFPCIRDHFFKKSRLPQTHFDKSSYENIIKAV